MCHRVAAIRGDDTSARHCDCIGCLDANDTATACTTLYPTTAAGQYRAQMITINTSFRALVAAIRPPLAAVPSTTKTFVLRCATAFAQAGHVAQCVGNTDYIRCEFF